MTSPDQPSHSPELPSDSAPAEIVAGLDKVRARLLDLTLSNRLLHFRHTKRSSLRVVDELPNVLWDRLSDGVEMTFQPVPEPPPDAVVQESSHDANGQPTERTRKPTAREHAEALGLATSFDLPEQPAEGVKDKASHRDGKIQTVLFAADLETSLRTIASAARSAIEETGTNMLHLVFGFLEWRDGTAEAKPLLAPLLTLPISLRRGDVDPRTRTYRYHVSGSGEDAGANVSLHEKLRRDFGIRLPLLDENEVPEAYFSRVREVIAPMDTWKVRRQLTLTLLSFGKLLMYQDLDAARWPQGEGPLAHPRVRELFGGVERGPYDVGKEYPLDDPSVVPDLPPIVLDADSSQHSAMVDVLRGRNVVIQGPPGTGKSQTIANLIGAAMVRGKTVLFVAEKLAALEVVRRRLDDVGLGHFCLELHSHKTQKQQMLRDVSARLEARGSFADAPGLDEKLAVLASSRVELTLHAERLHAPHGALGLTPYEVYWGRAARADALGERASMLEDAPFPDSTGWTLADVESAKAMVNTYGSHLGAILTRAGALSAHPWCGVTRPAPDGETTRRFVDVIEQLHARAGELIVRTEALLASTGVALESTHAALDPWLHEVAQLSSMRGVPYPELLARLDDSSCKLVEELCDAVDACARLGAALSAIVPKPVEVSAEELTVLRSAAEILGRVGPQAPTLAQVASHVEHLDRLRERLAAADGWRKRVSALLGVELPSTLGGLSATAEILSLSQSAPMQHLQLRGSGMQVEATEHVFRSALQEAQTIWEKRSSLGQKFELSLLPDADALKRHGGACSTAGPLRFLSAEYQSARQVYGTFSKAGAPDDPLTLARDFQQLAAHVAKVEAFNQNADYPRALGPGFRFMDTAFQDMATVRAWQLCVVQTLGWILPGARVVAERVADAPMEQLRSLTALVPDAAAERNAIQGALGAVHNHLGASAATPATELSVSDALARAQSLADQLRAALRRFQALGVTGQSDVSSLPDALSTMAQWAQQRSELREHPRAASVLGPLFAGPDTVTAPLRSLVHTSRALARSHLPDALATWLRSPDFAPRVELLLGHCQYLIAHVRQLDAAHAQAQTVAGLDAATFYRGEGVWSARLPAGRVAARAREAMDSAEQLPTWSGFLVAREQLLQRRIEALVALAERGSLAPEQLWPACEFAIYDRLLRSVLSARPELARFDGRAHAELRERFRRLDLETLSLHRARAAHKVDGRSVPEGVRTGPVATHTELALLEHECKKQRRHIPIRQLVRRAGRSLQALKPCFMMGPRAVAQYLEPGALEFDMVVMDEASQLRPEDGVGAICRARQVAVIGDPLQLPPTTFFDRLEDPDEIDEEQATTFDDAESILDVAGSVYSPVRRLRWHYRSRHESLIAFSNDAFYDGSLVVFPSPGAPGRSLGVRLEVVDNAVYRAGRNQDEAERVVDAILAHLRDAPAESLGVAAMNFKQRDLIEEILHRRLKDDDGTRALLDAATSALEPLFIKNLENVQGDERDVIFISVTYGKDEQGRLLQRFGPLNGSAGPRRLNVLFTRAKRRVVVFASFDPDELVLSEGASPGAKVLKRYLTYARERTHQPQAGWDRPIASDLERTVSVALRERGFDVVPKVGVAGAFVDLAVRHPRAPGAFVAGIVCDGPDYRAGFSARDRDRLRPAALNALGWNVVQLWTPDWYRDRAGTLDEIVKQIERGMESGVGSP